jgi:hypothetical protein
MTGVLAAGVRSAFCIVSAAALVAGCSGGERARPVGRPSNPGMESTIPTIGVGTPSLSRSPRAPGSPRIPGGLPDPRRIDQKNATAVSKAALIVMYTVDSTVDAGLRDAKRRAARYLTPDYTAKIKAEPRRSIHKPRGR